MNAHKIYEVQKSVQRGVKTCNFEVSKMLTEELLDPAWRSVDNHTLIFVKFQQEGKVWKVNLPPDWLHEKHKKQSKENSAQIICKIQNTKKIMAAQPFLFSFFWKPQPFIDSLWKLVSSLIVIEHPLQFPPPFSPLECIISCLYKDSSNFLWCRTYVQHPGYPN